MGLEERSWRNQVLQIWIGDGGLSVSQQGLANWPAQRRRTRGSRRFVSFSILFSHWQLHFFKLKILNCFVMGWMLTWYLICQQGKSLLSTVSVKIQQRQKLFKAAEKEGWMKRYVDIIWLFKKWARRKVRSHLKEIVLWLRDLPGGRLSVPHDQLASV